MKISIAPSVLSKFPKIVEGIVVAKGVNVETSQSRKINEMLRSSEDQLREKYKYSDLEVLPSVKEWDEIYRNVIESSELTNKGGVKFLPSHKNLAMRVLGGGSIPNVNPLVNYYNALSLKYLLPFGAEDLSKYYGDLQLAIVDGSEQFLEIGGHKVSKAIKGEVAWMDDHSVSCRMWAWRQSERTKVTRSTTDLIVIIDYMDDGAGINSLGQQATEEIAKGLRDLFGADVRTYRLDAEGPIVDIEYTSKVLQMSPEQVKEDLEKLSSGKSVGNKGIRKRKADPLGFKADHNLLADLSEDLKPYFPQDADDLGLAYSLEGHVGDVSSTLAFRYATVIKEAPIDSAKYLVSHAVEQKKAISAGMCPFTTMSSADNGFINIELAPEYLYSKLANAYTSLEQFGKSTAGDGKRILVESPGWNPNKTPHVGHMLNILLGKALIRLFNHIGLEAMNDDIINDKGLPVMQTVWAYQKFGDNSTPESTGDKPDHFVQRYYILGKKKYTDDPLVQADVKEILKKWEAGDKEIRVLWDRLVNWAYAGQRQTIERIWEEPGYAWYESDVYTGGKEIVNENLGKGVFEKIEDGAVIARIEQEYGLPDTIVLKSDGTGLYHTQDLHLTVKKKEKFQPWKIVWVVGEEQIAHFQRLFAILDAIKIMPIDDLYHFAYSVVVGKDGKKLSSRDGSDLSADDLMENMKEMAKAVLTARSSEQTEKQIDEISDAVAIGALKFSLLSRDPFKQIKFDVEDSLSFTGKSGPYIMYSYTRAKNIQKKLGLAGSEVLVSADVYDKVYSDEIRKLSVQVLRYPEVVIQSANNFSPGILAEYLFDLAKTFSNFYENIKVLDREEEERKALMFVVEIMMHVLKDGLGILGIKTLDEM